MLGASALVVSLITGLGELLGYGLRLLSGRMSDATGRFWPIILFGYLIQMLSVPMLALTSHWWQAAILILIERIGKATRNPPRDALLSYAAKRVGGYGWVFGLHEAMDQFGAMFGPLAVAALLFYRHSYHAAFAVLLIPALINLSLVFLASRLYPRPLDLDTSRPMLATKGLPRVFWIYLGGAALVAAGFADYPLLAYHFSKTGSVPGEWIAVFYAIAMGVSGSGSLALGKLFDRYGFKVLTILTAFSALFAPLVFLGGFWTALMGAAIWGIGMGVHESIIPAAVAPMVPPEKRASAFGLFTAGYGIFWFAGSAILGLLYEISMRATVTFCVTTILAAIPVFLWVERNHDLDKPSPETSSP